MLNLPHVKSAYAHDVSNVSIIKSATPIPIQQFIFVSKSKLNIYSSIIMEIRYPLCAAQQQQPPHTAASNKNNKYKQINLYVLSRRIYTNIYSWMHRCSWVVMIAKSFRCVSPNKFILCQKEQYLYLFRVCFISSFRMVFCLFTTTESVMRVDSFPLAIYLYIFFLFVRFINPLVRNLNEFEIKTPTNNWFGDFIKRFACANFYGIHNKSANTIQYTREDW